MTKENWLLTSSPFLQEPSFLLENSHCAGKIHMLKMRLQSKLKFKQKFNTYWTIYLLIIQIAYHDNLFNPNLDIHLSMQSFNYYFVTMFYHLHVVNLKR